MSLAVDPPPERRRGAPRGVTTEDAFEALANRRRRYAIHWLLEAETGTDIGHLARQIAAWENDEPLERVTSRERRRVYNALQQFHLPKLDDAGVVRYDADRGTVEGTEHLAELRVYLNAGRRSRRSRARRLAAGGAIVGLATAVASVASVALLPGAILGVLFGAAALGTILARRSARSPDETTRRFLPSTPEFE